MAVRELPFLRLDLNVQEDFFLPGAPLYVANAEAVRGRLRELARAWGGKESAALPTLALLDAHASDDAEFTGGALPPHALAGAPGARMLAELRERGAAVIPASGRRSPWPDLDRLRLEGGRLILEKRAHDGFSNPALAEVLRHWRPRELALCGAVLEQDLRATALTARPLGFEVVVLEDAAGRRDAAAAVKVRGELERRGVRFETTTAVIKRLFEWRARQDRREREHRSGRKAAPAAPGGASGPETGR
jgi:nicotinamidase-related amidase